MIDWMSDTDQGGADRNESEEFIRGMVIPLVAGKVRQRRSQGLGDEAIREAVSAFALDRASHFGEGGFGTEPGREELTSWIQQALEEALAQPWPDDLSEPLRRITDEVEGEPIMLANGEAWTFPRLDLQRYPQTLADGRIDMQYAWIQDLEGVELITELIFIETTISDADPMAALPHLMHVGSLLLRRNYSVTVAECRRLMPIDPQDPECLGELVALAPEDLPADQITGSRPITELIEGIVKALLTLLAPVIQDLRSHRSEDEREDVGQ
jgi:hypothetical protein